MMNICLNLLYMHSYIKYNNKCKNYNFKITKIENKVEFLIIEFHGVKWLIEIKSMWVGKRENFFQKYLTENV